MSESEYTAPSPESASLIKRKGTCMIDWSHETEANFNYVDEQVAENFRIFLKNLERDKTNLKSAYTNAKNDPNVLPGILRAYERAFLTLTPREEIALEWEKKGSAALTIELRRFVEIARRIDTLPNLTRKERVEKFLEEAGGKEHFLHAVEANLCTGCLHDVLLMIALEQ